MKSQLLKLNATYSYNIQEYNEHFFDAKFYYHPQIEIVYIVGGEGQCIIGDKILRFRKDDVFLLGSNLPHLFKNDEPETDAESPIPKYLVVHFVDSFWGGDFMNIPETKPLKQLLEKARRGIHLDGVSSPQLLPLLEAMLVGRDADRIIMLLQTLNIFIQSQEINYISSEGFRPQFNETDDHRISDIYSYTLNHFKEKILIDEVADLTHMTPTAFCRYFKSKTKKTYLNFLNEVRISHACKLLIEGKQTITQICFESGFNNFPSFYRCFKQITGKTPMHFQKDQQSVFL